MPTALIVEDEPEANELLAMLVQLRGYQTDSAFTGGEGLEMARRCRPDVVFLDLMLPDVNGYEICRALKAGRPTCAIPVVMVTARLAAENRIQGFRVGAAEYVPKPYTPDQIFDALARADEWQRALQDDAPESSIRLDTRVEVDHLRGLSRLWSLLLARTALTEEDAQALDRTLVDVATRAIEWGRRHGVGPVATLRYRWGDRGVALTLRDESGWFVDDSPIGSEGLGAILARGEFAELSYDSQDGQVAMLALAPTRP